MIFDFYSLKIFSGRAVNFTVCQALFFLEKISISFISFQISRLDKVGNFHVMCEIKCIFNKTLTHK